MAQQYDAIVIGAGQSGGPLSTALARAGRKTALVERVHVGGTCINEGCTPTKTMVASARVAYLARRAAEYGVSVGAVTVDMARVRQRKQQVVDSFRSSGEKRIAATEGLDLIYGEAEFTGPHAIAVDTREGQRLALAADQIFINTGDRPARPSLPGLDSVPTLDSTSIMELSEVPEHLLIMGGGYVALEFGQMFRRFGSQVTIIQRSKQLLSREDPDVAEEVAHILGDDGVNVLLQTTPFSAGRAEDDRIALKVRQDTQEGTLTGSHLLVAVGRTPNVERLNPAAAGIQLDQRGYIQVDDRLQTSVPGVYALGDVKGGPAFTHISYDDFRIIRTNLLENSQASTQGRMVPYTMFTDPQLGRIGLSETEARSQGRRIRVAKMPMSEVARAIEVDETRGFMKAIVDADTHQILGGAILGIEGGELMAMLEIAMLGRLPYETLRDGVFAHPTLAESWNNLFARLSE